MSRPTYAIIDTQAFVANYRYAKSIAPGSQALAVAMANAYGHGAVTLARALSGQADAFGVACSEEAMELRESGINNPILLLEGVFEPDEIALADRANLMLVVHSQYQLDWLSKSKYDRPITIWLKIDTGMHRLGFTPQEAHRIYRRLKDSPHIREVVLMSHFARADEIDSDATATQFDTFREIAHDLAAPFSLANSAATLAWPQTHAQWIRPGIMLYGSSPLTDNRIDTSALMPVMRLESELIAIRDLAAGESIGYGGRFTCDKPTRVGVVAAGYGDGYPRHAPDGTPVAVNGQRTQLIGRISMDMLTVDLSNQPNAAIGDTVQLWGDIISADEVAQLSETISYELFTGITRRVHFHYR